MDQQIQNQFRVASIVLLPPTRAAPNLGRVAQPDFVAQLFEQLFEPGAVTAGFQPDDDALLLSVTPALDGLYHTYRTEQG